MTLHAVAITGLHRITWPKPNAGGSIVLALFDCEANGFTIRRCAFVRSPRRGLTVWPPKLKQGEDALRPVDIDDDQLRSVMVREAQSAYRAMGGTDGEWEPRD